MEKSFIKTATEEFHFLGKIAGLVPYRTAFDAKLAPKYRICHIFHVFVVLTAYIASNVYMFTVQRTITSDNKHIYEIFRNYMIHFLSLHAVATTLLATFVTKHGQEVYDEGIRIEQKVLFKSRLNLICQNHM